MDFERATIKAILYDYPVEAAIKAIEDAQIFKGKDSLINIMPQFVRWREQSFTTTEARLMSKVTSEKWMVSPDIENINDIPYIYRPLIFFQKVANELLTEDFHNHNYPLVKFDKLFRWKDVTLHVGEDLLTIAYISARDAKRYTSETPLFLWPDTLHHDSPILNSILDKGISDVHAHFNATADIFHLNWIAMMNNLSRRNQLAKHMNQYQDIMFSTTGTEDIIPINRLCIAAAYLRAYFFKWFVLKETVKVNTAHKVLCILHDELEASIIRQDLQTEIDVLRLLSLHTTEGCSLDYAIQKKPETQNNKDNIYLIFHGERELMYRYMEAYFGNNKEAWDLAPYFYLYLLIKTRIRKEFVQINQLKGFENFQIYQNRKDICLEKDDIWSKQYGKYVVQTTLRPNRKDALEARITPNSLDSIYSDFSHSIFSNQKVVYSIDQKLTFVSHFIKEDYSTLSKKKILEKHHCQGSARFTEYKGHLKDGMDSILKFYNNQKTFKNWDKQRRLPKLVGIDAASTEMFCRPEVYGHVYRFAKKKGLYHRTYHVGEDFFDLTDGLRAIDEAILFLDLDSYCRIGHALAIGVDAPKYYTDRKYRVLMPRQFLLDNCIWTLIRAAENNISVSNALETALTRIAKKMYLEIGYPEPFDLHTYWNSMLLRGDEPDHSYSTDVEQILVESDWLSTAIVRDEKVVDARKDIVAKKLYEYYHYNNKIKVLGDENIDDRLPIGIEDVINRLQKVMLQKLSNKNIAIECNPTSNLKIGFFNRYDQHPLLTIFNPLESSKDYSYPIINASVNTDDRGVFATSSYIELSLIALALKKGMEDNTKTPYNQKYNHMAIADYIDHIRENGFKQRFILSN